MEYFVTGGTGFIGSHLVEELHRDGHDVVVLTRSRENAVHLPDDVTVVEGDVTEKATMREGMAGVDGVFHLAAWFQIGPGPWNEDTATQINVEGARNVLELMDELDVPKGVYASTVGVYGNTNGEFVDETYRAPNEFRTVYQETKWRAHYEVAEPIMEDGLPLVIATLGAIFGPGDKAYGGTPRTAFLDYLDGDLPVVPDDFEMSVDYVEDTAQNLYRAMQDGEPGEEYIIGSDPRPLVEPFEIAEELTGIDAPRTVPGSVFRWLGHGMSVVEPAVEPPAGFESEFLYFMSGGRVLVDNTKARRELGIQHRPIRDAVRQYLEWELDQQDMPPLESIRG